MQAIYDVWVIFADLSRGDRERTAELVINRAYLPDTKAEYMIGQLLDWGIYASIPFKDALRNEEAIIIEKDNRKAFVVAIKQQEDQLVVKARERTKEKRVLRRAYLLLHALEQEENDEDLLRGIAPYRDEINTVIEMMLACDFLLPGDI